jgi:hypothetical protein
VIVERETKLPDGTVITDRRTEDHSTERSDKKSETKESTVVTNQKPQYRLRGGAGYDLDGKQMQYMIGGEKRFWGPASLGLEVLGSQQSGIKGGLVTVSWEF